jgi:hypothetical protein
LNSLWDRTYASGALFCSLRDQIDRQDVFAIAPPLRRAEFQALHRTLQSRQRGLRGLRLPISLPTNEHEPLAYFRQQMRPARNLSRQIVDSLTSKSDQQ